MQKGKITEFTVSAERYAATLDMPVSFYYSIDIYQAGSFAHSIVAIRSIFFSMAFIATSFLAWRVVKLTETKDRVRY
jgi:hypothetical protein